MPDWVRVARDQLVDNASVADAGTKGDQQPETPPSDEDLLAGLSHQDQPEEEIPEWVARVIGLSEGGRRSGTPSPDVERRIAEEAPRETAAPRQDPEIGGQEKRLRDLWSQDVDTGESADGGTFNGAASGENAGNENAEINEWLRQLDATSAREQEPKPPRGVPATKDVPTWVDRMMGVPDAPTQGLGGLGDALPDWLTESAAAGEESPGVSSVPDGSRALQASPPSAASAGTIAAAPLEASPRSGTQAAEPLEVVPAFSPEEIHRIDVDAVFASMHMPDWLADVGSREPGSSPQLPPAAQEEEPIAPADLPSWVEAMRPVESAVTPAAGGGAESRLEDRGPLLGLHGVLPAIPGAAVPSSRPKPHSMKLDASEQHQAHAKLLEEMLAAETQPLPIQGAGQLRSQRALRWAISAVLVIVLSGAILSGSRNFPLPTAVPNESIAAIQAVQSIAPDAPVLAVFDYEPATVGEMEATAASLMDHLLLLKHPRLAVISTSPTGSALAERFISGTLADRAYVRGVQYVNLGYLPGGLAGVQSFAQDPMAAAPLGASTDRVWDSSVLLGTRRLSDFAAIIVLTESLEGGRVWIEQTAAARGASSMIIVSSAQAGPMLLPYFDSGQIEGLVAGLNGAAGAEIANSGLPGLVRRYWDAYSIGLYLAVLLITLGVLWHFWIGFRERRIEAV